MSAVVTANSASTLSEVEVGIHVGSRVDEPSVDVVNRVLHIGIGVLDNPGKRIVQDSVGHGLEPAGVADQPNVWVDLTITSHIFTFCVDCEGYQGLWTERGGNIHKPSFSESMVVFPTFEQSGHQYGNQLI